MVFSEIKKPKIANGIFQKKIQRWRKKPRKNFDFFHMDGPLVKLIVSLNSLFPKYSLLISGDATIKDIPMKARITMLTQWLKERLSKFKDFLNLIKTNAKIYRTIFEKNDNICPLRVIVFFL